MNKERRESLAEVESTIDEAIEQILDIIDEEQDSFDNLPDSLQSSNRGGDNGRRDKRYGSSS